MLAAAAKVASKDPIFIAAVGIKPVIWQVVELPRLAAATGEHCGYALGGTYIMFIGPRIEWTGR